MSMIFLHPVTGIFKLHFLFFPGWMLEIQYSLVKAKHIPAYKLETATGNPERGMAIRRKLLSESVSCSEAFNTYALFTQTPS